MAHVLFNGDIQRHPALRSLLWQWGVTVGRLVRIEGTNVRATVEDCDAVLQWNQEPGHEEIDFGAMPDGAKAEGVAAAAAPLLAIGPRPGLQVDHSWITIPEVGPGGFRLKVALQSCLERARELRGQAASRHEASQFRDFVGHELRSPLTAVKTALTALGDEKPPAPGTVRMLELAGRNLERLADTVEWSQELASLAETVPEPHLVPVRVAAVAGTIPDHLDFRLETSCEADEILTDLRLLGILARQMERVFHHAGAGCRPVFRLVMDPDNGDCRLTASVSEKGRGRPAWNRTEFENLARMLISPHLLQVLGAGTRMRTGFGDAAELSLGLPRWSQEASPAREPICTV